MIQSCFRILSCDIISNSDCLTSTGLPSKAIFTQNLHLGNSLAVQWLGLHDLTAEGPGSIPG